MNTDTMLTQIQPSPSQRVPPVPWGWRDMLFAVLLAAFGILLLNLLVVVASFLLHIPLHDDKDVLIVFVFLQDAVVIGAAWLFSIVRHHVSWRTLGLAPYSVGHGCGLSIALFLLSYVVRIVYGLIALALGVQLQQQEILTRLDMQGLGFLLTLLAAGVIAPIAEELFFRGFLYGGLRTRIGVVGAMVVSTVFFTALHMSLALFVPIFALGLFLAWLYESTGSLYPGMLMHSANNTVSLLLYFALQNLGLMPS